MKRTLTVLFILLLSVVVLTGCNSGEKTESGNTGNNENNTTINNSETTTDTTTVYRTIDFNSYDSDAKSNAFDDLVGKKVTFTNVPSLGGYLGNMSKGISCDNESTFNIEDGKTYIVSGIVVSTTGTYSVKMKSCSLIAN